MDLTDPIGALGEWILSNLSNVIFSVVTIIIGFIIYKAISKEIKRLKEKNRLEEHLAYTLDRIIKWLIFLVTISVILVLFGITLGIVSGLLTILGGTIIGFAAINTIGNAIAGLIVMTSRPFKVGDRIFFNGKFADIIAIELIYTKMMTLDNVLVSVPNQELLKTEIDNYGKKKVVRRQVVITAGFEVESKEVRRILLEAVTKVPRVLEQPKPYVRITNFQNFAVEYTIYVYINQIKKLREIDAEIFESILETCRENKLDISTPSFHVIKKNG
jgi:small conductance mechanosensitive channel